MIRIRDVRLTHSHIKVYNFAIFIGDAIKARTYFSSTDFSRAHRVYVD